MQKHHRLFSPATVDLDRHMQTEAQNQKLDMRIRKFLFAVSAVYQLPAAQLALEWLVRRYTVHATNIADVIRCILPYHSTKTFVRTVQVSLQCLRFSSPTQACFVARSQLLCICICICSVYYGA
jgi:hypothetical protein